MSKYSNEYVEDLERAAERMMIALEESISIIDNSRIALVNPRKAEASINGALELYHDVQSTHSNK